MADSNRERKPRIRKSAPTIRERAEAAAAKAEAPDNPGRLKTVASKLGSPFKKIKPATNNRAIRLLKSLFRPVGRLFKWLLPSYFVNSWREVRQVTWPSRKETIRLTSAVFIFAIVFGAIIASVDKGLDELFRKLVLK